MGLLHRGAVSPWQDVTPSGAGSPPPGVGDTAVLGDGDPSLGIAGTTGITITGLATVDSLLAGDVTLNGNFNANARMTFAESSPGGMTLAGGTFKTVALNGALTISGGAAVYATGDSNVAVNVNSGAFLYGDTASKLNGIVDASTISYSGAANTNMSVQAGGQFTTGDGTSGSVTVEGSGSSWQSNGTAAASIDVDDGGVVATQAINLDGAGAAYSGQGLNVTVDTRGSWTASGNVTMDQTGSDSSTLMLSGGGTIDIKGTFSVGTAAQTNGGGGEIFVRDAASTMTVESDMTATNASVQITGGGMLNVVGDALLVSHNSGRVPSLLSGNESLLHVGGNMTLADSGDMNLSVEAGSLLQVRGNLTIGSGVGSNGSLEVYSTGSGAVVSQNLFVGGSGGAAGGAGSAGADGDALLTVYHRVFISPSGQVVALFPDDGESNPGGRVYVGVDPVGPDGAVRIGYGGILCGKARQAGTPALALDVLGKVILGAGGRFQPGSGPDVFSIQGDCDLSDGGAGGGKIEVEIAGAGTAGTNYDELAVSGATTLGGTLRLVLLSGYAPKVGDTFQFIQSGSVTGSFAEIDSPSLTVSQTPSATGLTVAVTGITSSAAPTITSGDAPLAHVGTPYDFAVTASNDAAGFAATGLPDGLSIDAVTGQISGTPATAGSYTATLSATNASGTGTRSLPVTVAGAMSDGSPPTITSLPSADAQTGVAFVYQIDASGSPTSYAASSLPPGLKVDADGGLIYGIPTQTGTFPVGISATNGDGTSPVTALTVTVTAPPAPQPTSPLPTATLKVTAPAVRVNSGGSGVIKVMLSPAPTTPLTVAYSIKGTAANGVDYERLTGKKKFQAGKASKPILIVPLGDLGGASRKTVKIALLPGAGYTVGSTAPLKVKILAP